MRPSAARRLAAALGLAGVLLGAAACAPEPAPSPVPVSRPAGLVGTAWRLVSIQGRQPPIGRDVTMIFGSNGEVEGDGGCNSFAGISAYDPTTGALRLEALVSTKRACAEPARNDVEAAYFQALRTVTDASIDAEGRLVLAGPAAELVLAVGPQPIGPGVTPTPIAP
ncbi:MAG: META domain-containing protein [Candidatus Limnocylindrales bacterium]